MIRNYIPHVIILAIVAFAGIFASVEFLKMHHPEPLFPSEHLTEVAMLSDYFEGIKGTNGDTEIYIYDSGIPGGTALICGGAHPNECASYLATVLILENIKVTKGRVMVLPRLNNSAFTCTDPMEGFPQFYHIETEDGTREFRLGSRVTNPLDQWPDPLVFSHHPSNQQLSGFETRNINRAYPGREEGNLTERVGYAVLQLINQEKIDISFDLHESSPEVPIVNVIVYHEKNEEIAMGAVLGLEMQGENYSPELSPDNFHGLSHREWGDHTNTAPFLLETSNPSMGRIREATSEELVLEGKSKFYQKAKETGALRIAYDVERGEPIDHRVARHVIGVTELIFSYNMMHEERPIEVDDLPDYDKIMEFGTGHYLHGPAETDSEN
ncbi:MAG: succinylglutamate desuccinylase [Bacteroidota bacterium]